MERVAVSKAFTRLPCLPTSNLAMDVLDGTDDTLLVRDVYGGMSTFIQCTAHYYELWH